MFWSRPRRRSALLGGMLFILLLLPGVLAFFLPVGILPQPLVWLDSRLLLFYAWVAVATLLMLRYRDRVPLDLVGLGIHPWTLRELGRGALLGSIMAFVVVSPYLTEFDAALTIESTGSFLTLLFLVTLLAAGEELLFRGYLYQRVLEIVGELPGTLIVAIAFAAAHLGNPEVTSLALINIALAGILFGALWLSSRSLWSVIGLHAAWNIVVGPVFGLPVSGIIMTDTPLLRIGGELSDALLMGASFGPEGSLLTTAVLVASISFVALSRSFRIAPYTFARRYKSALYEKKLPENGPETPL